MHCIIRSIDKDYKRLQDTKIKFYIFVIINVSECKLSLKLSEKVKKVIQQIAIFGHDIYLCCVAYFPSHIQYSKLICALLELQGTNEGKGGVRDFLRAPRKY